MSPNDVSIIHTICTTYNFGYCDNDYRVCKQRYYKQK